VRQKSHASKNTQDIHSEQEIARVNYLGTILKTGVGVKQERYRDITN
jgi:hypothetical protein